MTLVALILSVPPIIAICFSLVKGFSPQSIHAQIDLTPSVILDPNSTLYSSSLYSSSLRSFSKPAFDYRR